MKRQFPYEVVASGGTPQPVFGTKTTAAVGPVGTEKSNVVSIPVTSSVPFVQGDWVVLDPLNSTAANRERLLVIGIPDSTHVKVQGMASTHLSGVYLQLDIEVAGVYIQTKPGNTGSIYIGGQGMVTSTGPFYVLMIPVSATGVQPIDWSDYIGSGQDVIATGDYWFDGTTGDSIIPSLTVL